MSVHIVTVQVAQGVGIAIMGGFNLFSLWLLVDAVLHGVPAQSGDLGIEDEWWRANGL